MRRAVALSIIVAVLASYRVVSAQSLQPRYLQAFAGNAIVSLNWSQPEAEVMGYWVYRALPNQAFQRLTHNPLDKPFYEDTAVVNGRVYWYTVSAIDADGHEGPRAEPVVAIPSERPGSASRY